MGLLQNVVWVLVPPDQVLARHYFLEQINKPEYIWGIRTVCLMSAVLFLFLYQRLKRNMEIAEAVVSGEAIASDNSSEDTDNVPVIEIAFASESAFKPESASALETVVMEESEPVPEPEEVPILETVVMEESEPVPEPEEVSVSEAVVMEESEPVPEPEEVPALETVVMEESEPVPEPEEVSVSEIVSTPESKSVIKQESTSEPESENNIWLWALVGVSVSIGGLILLSIYRKKRRVA